MRIAFLFEFHCHCLKHRGEVRRLLHPDKFGIRNDTDIIYYQWT
jgi:hypothetical protein